MRLRRRIESGTVGTLRVDARCLRLVSRLQPGDIAVVDQVDLDSATAQALLARGVAAVVNAAPSSSGRFPNLGPRLLVGAGIPLVDDVGQGVITALRDGRAARLEGDALWVDGTMVARGMRQDADTVALAAEAGRAGVAAQLADLTGGAPQFVLDERALLLDGHGLPALVVSVEGRHAVVVGPSYDALADLRLLRRYRRRHRPVLVGVDGGVDVLLSQGLRPDLAVGDPATMSDEGMASSRERVFRAQADGWDRVLDLAVPSHAVTTRAASEDLALLLLHHRGATQVVSAGLPRGFEELLDRGRQAATSSLVTRAAVGARLVPAQMAALLTPRRPLVRPLLTVVLVAALAGSVLVGQAPLLELWRRLLG